MFGLALDADVEESANPPSKEAKVAMQRARLALDRWLREPATDSVAMAQAEARAQGKSGFKDPAEMFKHKE